MFYSTHHEGHPSPRSLPVARKMTSTEFRIILGVLQMKKMITMTMNILAIPWSLFSLLLALAFLSGEFLDN